MTILKICLLKKQWYYYLKCNGNAFAKISTINSGETWSRQSNIIFNNNNMPPCLAINLQPPGAGTWSFWGQQQRQQQPSPRTLPPSHIILSHNPLRKLQEVGTLLQCKFRKTIGEVLSFLLIPNEYKCKL